jgi:hypothetical protein
MKRALAIFGLLCLSLGSSVQAHVGSPDVYYEGTAGPYRLFVTVRVPQMVPGVAQIEVRTLEGNVDDIEVVALRAVGEGSENAPPPDLMERSKDDAQFFTGKLWLMQSGAWQVRIQVKGPQGNATMAVPVAAFSQRTLRMQKTTGLILSALMIFLVLSLISIFGAATRESQIEPGAEIPPARRTRARIAMLAVAALIAAILFLGNMWWTSIADANAKDMVYKAPPIDASLVGNELVLKMGSSYWHDLRKEMQMDKIIPDHGHLMHLFLIRMPEMDRFYHLHPEETGTGEFKEMLPAVEPGHYAVFADIVRESGFPDTMTAQIDLPARNTTQPMTGDDSETAAPPISGSQASASVPLGVGERVEWLNASSIQAQKPTLLRFRVVDKDGKPATDLQPYMGMAGHLVIFRRDLGVFAHVHPSGSVPMAALMLLEKTPAGSMESMPGMHETTVPAEITFPYGFPQAGDYRLFLQMKRAGHVETAVFDTHVTP